MNASSSWIIYIFQFTPLREGRPAARKQEEGRQIFQFTPLREGRRFTSPSCSIAQSYFNSRPCGRGVGLAGMWSCWPIPYFNSRPCGRGDGTAAVAAWDEVISIHAPAGGATGGVRGVVAAYIFQFTPLREGRHGNLAEHPADRRNFNSRPCGRGDADNHLGQCKLRRISIHAPAGGATAKGYKKRK